MLQKSIQKKYKKNIDFKIYISYNNTIKYLQEIIEYMFIIKFAKNKKLINKKQVTIKYEK